MKRVTTLKYIDNIWVLSFIEDEEEKQFTSPNIDEIKAKCNEYGFNLNFTGVMNVSK